MPTTPIDPEQVSRVRARVREAASVSGRNPDAVNVLAATKYLDPTQLPTLVDAGVTDLAENRLESLAAKQSAVAHLPGVSWHFIGQLQSRKVEVLAPLVSTIHTLCSESAARKLAALAGSGSSVPDLLVQVNIAADPAKAGLAPAEVPQFLESLPETLVVRGLMTMPAFTEDPEVSRAAFSALRELAEQLQERFGDRHPVGWLSMGTSQDYLVAVQEGATHVRLGRILYAEQE